MKTLTEMRQDLAQKAAGDEGFRSALIADPKSVVAREYGIDVPSGLKIAVHEDSATTAHLILDPSPQLSDADLEVVSGSKKHWNKYSHDVHEAFS